MKHLAAPAGNMNEKIKKTVGLVLLVVLIAINSVVALQFYNIGTIKLNTFFFWQAKHVLKEDKISNK